MWLIIFMIAIVLPLIIWGFVANRNENKFVDEAIGDKLKEVAKV